MEKSPNISPDEETTDLHEETGKIENFDAGWLGRAISSARIGVARQPAHWRVSHRPAIETQENDNLSDKTPEAGWLGRQLSQAERDVARQPAHLRAQPRHVKKTS